MVNCFSNIGKYDLQCDLMGEWGTLQLFAGRDGDPGMAENIGLQAPGYKNLCNKKIGSAAWHHPFYKL